MNSKVFSTSLNTVHLGARTVGAALLGLALFAGCSSGDGGSNNGTGSCFDDCVRSTGNLATCNDVCGGSGTGGGTFGTGGATGTGGGTVGTGGGGGMPQPPNLAIGQQVPWPTGDWTVVPPEQMNMDPAQIELAMQYAFGGDKSTQSVVIIRGGAIVAERYADSEFKNKDSMTASWSMAKSFTSALIGIAISEGRIPNVDTPLRDLGIGEFAGDPRGDIPLRAVLQMQSGLWFQEDYNDLSAWTPGAPPTVFQLSSEPDSSVVPFRLPMHPSGANGRWYYSSADTQLLGIVLERTTGMNATAYAQQKLFPFIGMHNARWWLDGANHSYTYCCIDAPTREFAKFGLLFLRGGNWDGQQVVPANWVTESTQTNASHFPGYAYQWWTSTGEGGLPPDMYSAQGLDSQRIYVIPSLDLVVAKNTLYSTDNVVAPGQAGGWINKIQPRFGYQNGTGSVGAAIWDDIPFMGPIINSIEGSTKLDAVSECTRGNPPDVNACNQIIPAYMTTPQQGQCVCDRCAGAFLDCNSNPGCAELIQCAVRTGCASVSTIDCATPCAEEINKFGGVDGCSVQLALILGECQGSVTGQGCL